MSILTESQKVCVWPHAMAFDILAVLPEVMAVLPRDEVDAVLNDLPRMT